MLGDPIVVGAVCILLAAVAVVCIGCWALCKGIKYIYDCIFPAPTPTPEPKQEIKYDWQTIMSSLDNYYTYSPLAWNVYADIQDKFNGTVPTRPADFYTRQDLDKLPRPGNYLHLNIGGEGCFLDGDMLSGFKDAINVNVQKHNSQYKSLDIPFLIQLSSWEAKWPFGDDSADLEKGNWGHQNGASAGTGD